MAPLNRFNQITQIDNHINQRVESESRQINTYQLIQQAGQLISSVQGFAQPNINNSNAVELTSEQINMRNEFNNKINSTLAELEQNNSDGKLNSLIQGLKGVQSALNGGIDNAISRNKAKVKTEETTETTNTTNTTDTAETTENTENNTAPTVSEENVNNAPPTDTKPEPAAQPSENTNYASKEEAVEKMRLRQTSCKGVYCERQNPNKDKNDYTEQRHFVWNDVKKQMEEISGVYFINYNGTAKNGEIIKNSVLQAHLQNYNCTSISGIYEKDGKNYKYNAETNSFEETTINPSDENTNPQTEITENTEVPVHNEEGTGDIDDLDPPEGEVLGEKEAEIISESIYMPTQDEIERDTKIQNTLNNINGNTFASIDSLRSHLEELLGNIDDIGNNRVQNNANPFSSGYSNSAFDGFHSRWVNGWRDYLSGVKSYSEAFGHGGGGSDVAIHEDEQVNNLHLLDSIKW